MKTASSALLACLWLGTLAACGGGGSSGGGGGGGPTAPASTTQVLVKPTSLLALQNVCAAKGATVIGPVEGTEYYLVEVPDGVSADDFRKDLQDELEVEDAESDSGCEVPEESGSGGTAGGGGSTIPLFGEDDVAAIATQPALTTIGAIAAHGRGFDGTGVIVALLDTGVFPTHPSLLGHLQSDGWDFVDGDANPTDVPNGLDDDHDGLVDEGVGHGTFVASLILAVAPGAKILPIRVLNSDAVGTASAVAQGISYAVSHGAHVINLSAGFTRSVTVVEQAIATAKAAGVLVIACAGNRASSVVDFPADVGDVQAVTSLTASSMKAPFASWGSSVDFSGPGVDLLGAHPLGAKGTARWSGTSFTTALVTGGFALLRDRDPLATGASLFQRLRDTSVSVDAVNPGYQGKLGRGRINLDAATSGP